MATSRNRTRDPRVGDSPTALGDLARATGILASGVRVARSIVYLVYNAFSFCSRPFNSLFLLYIAFQALALFSNAALGSGSGSGRTTDSMRRLPVKGLAIFVWTIVV